MKSLKTLEIFVDFKFADFLEVGNLGEGKSCSYRVKSYFFDEVIELIKLPELL